MTGRKQQEMGALFDDISRILASPMPRRQALCLFARAVAGSAMVGGIGGGTATGGQRPSKPTGASLPCKTRREGDSLVAEFTGVLGASAGQMLVTAGLGKSPLDARSLGHSGRITVWVGGQQKLYLQFHASAPGRIEIREEISDRTRHLLQLSSSDGVSLNGTFDGRALETLKIADGRIHIARHGVHYADGSRVATDILSSSTMSTIRQVAAALQTNASKCSESGAPLPSGDPREYGRPRPMALFLPQPETPGTALPCVTCTGTCVTGLAACSLGAIAAGLGCGIFGWLCVAITLAACAIIFQGCELNCYLPGSGCCPVNCGWPGGCCLQGHTCTDPQTHTCCAVVCGTGCCNEGDTCFTNTLGASDCCPRGQQICPGPHGAQCCGRDHRCNGITGECCSADTEICGSAGCCPAGTCNNNPSAPSCCTGKVGQPGGRCGAGPSLGCCPPGQTCNPMTNTCCTGQPCGAAGCCEPGHCNNFPDAYACCPGALGQPGGPCNGLGATAQHCCPPDQICVNAEFIDQPGGCCPAPRPGVVIDYHGCRDNPCCQHACNALGLC